MRGGGGAAGFSFRDNAPAADDSSSAALTEHHHGGSADGTSGGLQKKLLLIGGLSAVVSVLVYMGRMPARSVQQAMQEDDLAEAREAAKKWALVAGGAALSALTYLMFFK